jgi:hypothetical protein
LIDIEDGVLAHHRYQATFGFVADAVLHLQLLDEVDLRAVLALAHMPARVECLFES